MRPVPPWPAARGNGGPRGVAAHPVEDLQAALLGIGGGAGAGALRLPQRGGQLLHPGARGVVEHPLGGLHPLVQRLLGLGEGRLRIATGP